MAIGSVSATNRRISLRILPLLCAMMFVSYLDRITLSYAGPKGMNVELGLSATAFGFAAGIFFVGYILFELPSNIALHRFGGRAWLSRIAVTWGVVQCLTAVAPNAEVLYLLRFMLGVAEAGFTPGVMLYLTFWFGHDYRGRAVSRFLVSALVATVIGAPLAHGLISVGDVWQPWDLGGWRLLMLVTGVPAIVLGVVAWFYLDDSPREASWLRDDEKDDLERRLAKDAGTGEHGEGIRTVLRDPRMWLMGLCHFAYIYGAYTLTFFLPTIVAGFESQFGVRYSPWQAALLTASPFAFGALAQLWVARRTDRRGRLGAHMAVSAVIGFAGGLAAVVAGSPIVLIVCLTVMGAGITGGAALPLVMATKAYTGVRAAAFIALVNTVGLSAGFVGPYLTGWLRDVTGSQNAGIVLMAVLLIVAGSIGYRLDRRRPARHEDPESAGDPGPPSGNDSPTEVTR